MVKKLIKFEFIAWFRTMLPMLLILLGISGLTRIVQLFEAETATYSIVNTSSIVALCISILVCCCAVRFYADAETELTRVETDTVNSYVFTLNHGNED